MSTRIATLPAISRPKVHRLPSRAQRTPRLRLMAEVLSYGNAAKFTFTLASLVLVITLSALVFGKPMSFATNRAPDLSAASEEASVPVASSQKTILLKDDKGVIIGQIAKMSPFSPAAGDISTLSEIDNHREQELLSILNKN